jgi:hypothetical protein
MTITNIVPKVVVKEGFPTLHILPYVFGNKGYCISYCDEAFVDCEIAEYLSDSFATVKEFQALLAKFGAEQFHHVFEYSPTDSKPVQDSYFQKLEDCEKAVDAIFTVIDVNRNRQNRDVGRSFTEQSEIFQAIKKSVDRPIVTLADSLDFFEEFCEVFTLPALIEYLEQDEEDPTTITEDTIRAMSNCTELTSGNWLLIS